VLESLQPNRFHIACYQDKSLVPLMLKPTGQLHFHQEVSIESGKIRVEEYIYRYSVTPKSNDGEQWILRYEYSRNPEWHVPHAHLHINANRGNRPLGRVHFPTGGRVSIEQIIAHLIIEYNVIPRCDNWFEILTGSHQGFIERRDDEPEFS